ncbi:hypothetical protein DSCO28_35130 [Desulfosarcina ovata subsp. sediminis]|uniref:Uncharacterized protein n=1 Tax=Desulfosarcina ovata subsp. sediminis TaxID=885957 RepID=A0A5K7ZRV6_9BACT|nr:tetratricopeptide repeat protein [Desulfosarcina ovata]BBO82947.1 hypothetical protein DSCO28_35130 [Desulfosarcina ovata subsp. sediminis]
MAKCRLKASFYFIMVLLLLSSCATPETTLQNQKNAKASRKLGEAYLADGNFRSALGELLKAEALNPNDPFLHNDLGLVYNKKEKLDLAVIHFKKAIELNPSYSQAKNNLGSVFIIQKQWDNAIAVLEEVTGDMLYATPHFPLTNLGIAYYYKGRYDKARHYLKKALALKPDFFLAQLNLGRTYLATGELNEARTILEKAAETYPENPALLLEMGRTYRRLGDSKTAVLALKGAIELTEDSNLAVEASEELKKIYR